MEDPCFQTRYFFPIKKSPGILDLDIWMIILYIFTFEILWSFLVVIIGSERA